MTFLNLVNHGALTYFIQEITGHEDFCNLKITEQPLFQRYVKPQGGYLFHPGEERPCPFSPKFLFGMNALDNVFLTSISNFHVYRHKEELHFKRSNAFYFDANNLYGYAI